MKHQSDHHKKSSFGVHTLVVLLIALAGFFAFAGLATVKAADTTGAGSSETGAGVNWPSFDRTAPLKKEFVATKHYNFSERFFKPSVVVEQLDTPIEVIFTPEQSVKNHISAMRAGDYEWWLQTMDVRTREMIQKAEEANGVTVEDRQKQWAEQFKDVNVTMERWIETGRFLIISVRLWPKGAKALAAQEAGKDARKEIPIVMSIMDGSWLVTAMLGRDDPVVANYDHPVFEQSNELSIERIIRE